MSHRADSGDPGPREAVAGERHAEVSVAWPAAGAEVGALGATAAANGAPGAQTHAEGVTVEVISGTEQHNLLSALHPDTTVASPQPGDLIVAAGDPASWQRFAAGSVGTFLKRVTGALEWASLAGEDIASGTVADARLSSNVCLKDADETITGTWNFSGDLGMFSSIGLMDGGDAQERPCYLMLTSVGGVAALGGLTFALTEHKTSLVLGAASISLNQSLRTTNSPTFADVTLSNLAAKGAVYADASKQLETLALTNGQLMVGSTGAIPVAASLSGTANQVTVTGGAGTITLSLPQNIHTGASPTFVRGTLTQATGTAPLTVSSTTMVGNLNVQYLGGNQAADFALAGHTHTGVYAPVIHNLVDATNHPVSGLTTGHFLKATGATTYGFAAHGLTYSDVGAAASSHAHSGAEITSGAVAAAYGGTAQTTWTKGDLLYASANNTLAKLALGGTVGWVLTVDAAGIPAWAAAAGGGAPTNAKYVVIDYDGTLSDERKLTGTANQVTVIDNGAGSTVVLSLPQSIHTAATPQFGHLGLGVAASATIGAKITCAAADDYAIDIDRTTAATTDTTGGHIMRLRKASAAAFTASGQVDYGIEMVYQPTITNTSTALPVVTSGAGLSLNLDGTYPVFTGAGTGLHLQAGISVSAGTIVTTDETSANKTYNLQPLAAVGVLTPYVNKAGGTHNSSITNSYVLTINPTYYYAGNWSPSITGLVMTVTAPRGEGTGAANIIGLAVNAVLAGSAGDSADFVYGLKVAATANGATGWAANFSGNDVQIASGTKLILEGTETVKGDSYFVFQNNRIEVFVNNVLEGYIDATGFVST